jgi:hypothetical protein
VCHDVCQAPTAGSCQGTTPGSCTNISGGTQTCGVGQCARTIDKCSNGAPQTCTPGQPSAEVCDGVDNDCDGLTDAADPDLVIVNCDNQKGVCAGAKKPASLCQAGTWKACTDANYSAYSANYQAGRETSCETSAVAGGLDNDCDGSVDEDFSYTGPDGTAVQGAGKACGVGVCAGGTTICGVGNTLICTGDVRIATETCDGSDNDCDGKSDSLDPSLQLIACDNQKGVCSGSTRPASLCAAGTWQNCTSAVYTAFSASYQASETLCDGKDNDCSGAVDNGLVAPNNSNQNGACAGTKKLCAGATGWVDNYGSVAGFGLAETPNGNFADENCDGIDGDVNLGLFVTTTGSATSACTQAEPCTIARALALVSAQKPQIYMQVGSYTGGPWTLNKTMSIFGGYNTSWLRKARGTGGHEVRLYGGAYGAEGHAITLVVTGAGVTVGLNDLFVHGVNASGTYSGYGRSSYVVHATTAALTVERCDIVAANGAAGLAGNNGASASQSKANSGGGGGDGREPCEPLSCDTSRPVGGGAATNSCPDSTNPNGGAGGAGGSRDTASSGCGPFGAVCCYDATAGLGGTNAATTSGSLGTGGGGSGTCSNNNGAGQPGRVVDGDAGSGSAAASGFLSNGYWYAFAGTSGTRGENGGGGGGGGGAGGCNNGGCDASGGGGGGGGAGGCRASAAGGGGYGGGGSFGIFGNGSAIAIYSTTISRGVGGAGGGGGSGGAGQPGGDAGAAGAGAGNSSDGSFNGRPGGAGARGGNAGAGGGGAGGASYGILRYSGSLATDVNRPNTFSGGSGGSGGAGGTTGINGSAGTGGTSTNTATCAAPGGC